MCCYNFSNYCKGTSPFYVNEIFAPSHIMENNKWRVASGTPFRKSNLGWKTTSFTGPSIWKELGSRLKISTATTSFSLFTHNYKKLVLKSFSKENLDIVRTSIIIIRMFIVISMTIVLIFWKSITNIIKASLIW